jgi:hypothetical protein
MGSCGVSDEWGQRRASLPLNQPAEASALKEPLKQALGKGRIAFLPPVSLPQSPNKGLSSAESARLAPLLDLLQWASGHGPAAVVGADDRIEIATSFNGRDTLLVHLVNYAVNLDGEVEATTDVPVKVRLPAQTTVQSAAVLSPDGDQPSASKASPRSLACEVLTSGPDRSASFVVPRLLIYDQIELHLKPAPALRSDLPRLLTTLQGEAAPGGLAELRASLSAPAPAKWQVSPPPGWQANTASSGAEGMVWKLRLPPQEHAGRHRVRVSARLRDGNVLTDEVWVPVEAPLEVSLRLPPYADTRSGRTKVAISLRNRLAQPLDAQLAFTPPPGWTVEGGHDRLAVGPQASASLTAWLKSSAGPKPGAYDLQVAATAGSRRATASATISVLDNLKALACPKVAPPKLDGVLDEACWQGPPAAADFQRTDGKGSARQQTRAWVCYDSQSLFVAFECVESEPKTIINLVDQDGGEVWRDDSVEVFLDPTLARQAFRHYVVNVVGRRHPASGWTAATSRTPTGWAAEIAIPLDPGAPSPGDMWGINLCRTRPARPQAEPEYSAWSFTEGSFHRPERFGVLVFEPTR